MRKRHKAALSFLSLLLAASSLVTGALGYRVRVDEAIFAMDIYDGLRTGQVGASYLNGKGYQAATTLLLELSGLPYGSLELLSPLFGVVALGTILAVVLELFEQFTEGTVWWEALPLLFALTVFPGLVNRLRETSHKAYTYVLLFLAIYLSVQLLRGRNTYRFLGLAALALSVIASINWIWGSLYTGYVGAVLLGGVSLSLLAALVGVTLGATFLVMLSPVADTNNFAFFRTAVGALYDSVVSLVPSGGETGPASTTPTDAPGTATDAPQTATDVPGTATDTPQTATDVPGTATDTPQTATPDGTESGSGDGTESTARPADEPGTRTAVAREASVSRDADGVGDIERRKYGSVGYALQLVRAWRPLQVGPVSVSTWYFAWSSVLFTAVTTAVSNLLAVGDSWTERPGPIQKLVVTTSLVFGALTLGSAFGGSIATAKRLVAIPGILGLLYATLVLSGDPSYGRWLPDRLRRRRRLLLAGLVAGLALTSVFGLSRVVLDGNVAPYDFYASGAELAKTAWFGEYNSGCLSVTRVNDQVLVAKRLGLHKPDWVRTGIATENVVYTSGGDGPLVCRR